MTSHYNQIRSSVEVHRELFSVLIVECYLKVNGPPKKGFKPNQAVI